MEKDSSPRCRYLRSLHIGRAPVRPRKVHAYEEGEADTTSDPVISSMYLDDMLHPLRKENPVFLDIVYLRADGLTLDEISERLNIPRTTLYRMLQKIRRIAEKV